MQHKLEEFLEHISATQDLNGLQNVIFGLRDLYEVEHLVYHSVNSVGEQYAALTYDPEWVDRYIAQDYARIDPVVQGCYNRFHPVDWKLLNWSGKAQRSFLGEALEAGVGNQGFSVPIRGPGGQFAMFTVSQNCTDEEWSKLTQAHMRDLILIAHFINQKALELEKGTDHTPTVSLSPRETDALTLLSMGLSRAQAAESLTISEHTLRVYIESARFKLGATNTTHAVARAIGQGLLIA